jgi:hypothetical protein
MKLQKEILRELLSELKSLEVENPNNYDLGVKVRKLVRLIDTNNDKFYEELFRQNS